MIDLKDALGWADDIIAVTAQDQYEPMVVHVEKIVEAARLVANPDLDVATVAVTKAWRNARPATATVAWTPSPDLLAKAAVFAALDITETTE